MTQSDSPPAQMLAGSLALAVALFVVIALLAGVRTALLGLTVSCAGCAVGLAAAKWREERRATAAVGAPRGRCAQRKANRA